MGGGGGRGEEEEEKQGVSLPPMWPGLDSQTLVEFVVGSRPRSKGGTGSLHEGNYVLRA